MTDFFDWLTASVPGDEVERLREQFRLSTEEMRRTTQALAPAFLLGFTRLAARPAAFADMVRQAATLDAQGDGAAPMNGFLGALFGAGVMPEAVARQASLMAGVAPDTIARMMPELALLSVQAMTRMTGGSWAGAMPFAGDAGGQMLAETLRRSANAVEAFHRPSSKAGTSSGADLPSLFADALTGGFPWMRPPSRGAAVSANPFSAFEPMMEAFARSGDKPAKQPEAKPEPAADPLDTFLGLAQAGRNLQESYALEMLALFDRNRSASK
ncbi:hypothetical protein [Aureimonas mangrovi]|uniref:hypothetical protein n=1 Tax=Aureimonas mangrovi TaxID=2758041 RepID=UPI00163DBCF2|nr:hypothetical protein [Aureimonas mangrovi]